MASVRLQKALSHAGVSSRRAGEKLISAGRVRVDGQVVTELGTQVDPRRAHVEVDGRRVIAEAPVYIVLHKPRSVVSTMHDPEGRPTVRELFAEVAVRVYPIGRLDFATSGVLLATNDGDFAEGMMHPRRGVPKTYVLKVQGEMQPKDLDAWRYGVELEDGKTLPAKVKLLRHEGTKTWFELTITEGRNQQVRRMGDATGFRVMRLARTEFAGIGSEGLRPGEWRYLTADELTTLKHEFGVPKRVVSPPRQPVKALKAPRVRATPDGARRDERGAARGEGGEGGGRPPHGDRARGRREGGRAEAGPRGREGARERVPGPGYGHSREGGRRGARTREARAGEGRAGAPPREGASAREGAWRSEAPRGREGGRGGPREAGPGRGREGREGGTRHEGGAGRGRAREAGPGRESTRGAPREGGRGGPREAGPGRPRESGRGGPREGGAPRGRKGGPGRSRETGGGHARDSGPSRDRGRPHNAGAARGRDEARERFDTSARYGGGAPARRDVDVRDHWGGAVRRGSSGGRDDDRGRPSEDRGRSGGTRTTGTGGGIGAEPGGDYRVRGRRG